MRCLLAELREVATTQDRALTWYEKLGVAGAIATFAGFIVTFIALAIAWNQLKRTADAAVAAASAAKTARSDLIRRHLDLLLGQMRFMKTMVDSSAASGDARSTRMQLETWNSSVGHTVRMLAVGPEDYGDFLALINRSTAQARDAIDALVSIEGGSGGSVIDDTRSARRAIARVCDSMPEPQ
jgi:hypothetical protein